MVDDGGVGAAEHVARGVERMVDSPAAPGDARHREKDQDSARGGPKGDVFRNARVTERDVQEGPAKVAPEEEEAGVVLHQRLQELKHLLLGGVVQTVPEHVLVAGKEDVVVPQEVHRRPLVGFRQAKDVLNRPQAPVVVAQDLEGVGGHDGAQK
jgi:hypothetical protein